MLLALLGLQVVTLLVVVVLLTRKAAAPVSPAPDSRLDALLAADLPGQLARMDSRAGVLDEHLRSELRELRAELTDGSNRLRASSDESSRQLREEVQGSIRGLGTMLQGELSASRNEGKLGAERLRVEVVESMQALGQSLHQALEAFRTDNKTEAERLRSTVEAQLARLAADFGKFSDATSQRQLEEREALHNSLRQLNRENAEQSDKLRGAVEERLRTLAAQNEAKLDEMRATVDEKLQKTLNERLTQSFGQVTTHLGEVQKGLGEMKELASGVGDLKKVLTNVKARGNVGEFLLGQQLEQMFSREQYAEQVTVKPGSGEKVDFALKFPNGPDSTVLLPIDAKFPQDVGQKLMDSYEHGSAEEIAEARKAFERAIRLEGKKICEKYVDPPATLPHAVMFLPTEGLYAEVTRIPGLQSELQQQCRVTIAGPSTFMAILTSFQMGFHTLAIEKKGNEVWNVLGRVRGEFEKFGGLMEKVEANVGTVQNALKKIRSKTTTINRALKNVASLDTGTPAEDLMSADNLLPLLAAADGDEEFEEA